MQHFPTGVLNVFGPNSQCAKTLHPSKNSGGLSEGLGTQHGFKRVGFIQQRGEGLNSASRWGRMVLGVFPAGKDDRENLDFLFDTHTVRQTGVLQLKR